MFSLGISCLTLLFLCGYAAGEVTTNGASGDMCGTAPNQKKCLTDVASCNAVTGECDCDPARFKYGDGSRKCYKKNTFRTEVFADPTVLTYNDVFVNLPLPCRYKWTHTKTYLKDTNRNRVGYCYFEAFANHNKDKGKFYQTGFDVAIELRYDNGTVEKFSVRKYGEASNAVYTYDANVTFDEYYPNGPWNPWDASQQKIFHDPSTNLLLNCQSDANDNLFHLKAKKCGIDITMRGYDTVQRRGNPQVPFLSYGVNCAFHPEFLDQDRVVAIPPVAHGGKNITMLKDPSLRKEEFMVYRALTSGATQNGYKHSNEQCTVAKDALVSCPNDATRNKALKGCMWVLEYPRFIRCWDKTYSGEDIMKLYTECVDMYCAGASCPAFKTKVSTNKCSTYQSPPAQTGLDTFLALDCSTV